MAKKRSEDVSVKFTDGAVEITGTFDVSYNDAARAAGRTLEAVPVTFVVRGKTLQDIVLQMAAPTFADRVISHQRALKAAPDEATFKMHVNENYPRKVYADEAGHSPFAKARFVAPSTPDEFRAWFKALPPEEKAAFLQEQMAADDDNTEEVVDATESTDAN